MTEVGEWAKQTNKPHFTLNLPSGKVGLISSRWGLNKNFKDIKLLLATENQKKNLVKDVSFISESVRELKATPEQIFAAISNSYTPKAFQHTRNF